MPLHGKNKKAHIPGIPIHFTKNIEMMKKSENEAKKAQNTKIFNTFATYRQTIVVICSVPYPYCQLCELSGLNGNKKEEKA